jgi:hypothetical protein
MTLTCNITVRGYFVANFYIPFSPKAKRRIIISTRAYRNRGRYSVLIVLIYFLLSPMSKIPNCVLTNFVGNATPRIKRFENFCHSLWMLLPQPPTIMCIFVHILNLILQFHPFNFVFSQNLPSYYCFTDFPRLLIINKIFVKSLQGSLSCKK